VPIDRFRLPWSGAQNARDRQNEGDGARGTYAKAEGIIFHVEPLAGQFTRTVPGACYAMYRKCRSKRDLDSPQDRLRESLRLSRVM
jgi:hypothetical protein